MRTWFAGDWRARLSPIKRSLTVRTHEATFLAFSLGLWPLGWVVGWFWRRPRAHERSFLDSVETGALCWAAVTVVVWTLLLFLPEAARNHQGTYLVQLLVFLGTGSRMVRVAPAFFLSLLLVNWVNFALQWLTAPAPPLSPRWDGLALAALVGTFATLAWVGVWAWRRREGDARPFEGVQSVDGSSSRGPG